MRIRHDVLANVDLHFIVRFDGKPRKKSASPRDIMNRSVNTKQSGSDNRTTTSSENYNRLLRRMTAAKTHSLPMHPCTRGVAPKYECNGQQTTRNMHCQYAVHFTIRGLPICAMFVRLPKIKLKRSNGPFA